MEDRKSMCPFPFGLPLLAWHLNREEEQQTVIPGRHNCMLRMIEQKILHLGTTILPINSEMQIFILWPKVNLLIFPSLFGRISITAQHNSHLI